MDICEEMENLSLESPSLKEPVNLLSATEWAPGRIVDDDYGSCSKICNDTAEETQPFESPSEAKLVDSMPICEKIINMYIHLSTIFETTLLTYTDLQGQNNDCGYIAIYAAFRLNGNPAWVPGRICGGRRTPWMRLCNAAINKLSNIPLSNTNIDSIVHCLDFIQRELKKDITEHPEEAYNLLYEYLTVQNWFESLCKKEHLTALETETLQRLGHAKKEAEEHRAAWYTGAFAPTHFANTVCDFCQREENQLVSILNTSDQGEHWYTASLTKPSMQQRVAKATE